MRLMCNRSRCISLLDTINSDFIKSEIYVTVNWVIDSTQSIYNLLHWGNSVLAKLIHPICNEARFLACTAAQNYCHVCVCMFIFVSSRFVQYTCTMSTKYHCSKTCGVVNCAIYKYQKYTFEHFKYNDIFPSQMTAIIQNDIARKYVQMIYHELFYSD